MLIDYLPIIILTVLATALGVLVIIIGRIFGPHRPTATKTALYECGMPSISPVTQRFSVKFYLVAVLFILFDLEAVFLYPWAVTFREFVKSGSAMYVFGEMSLFLGTLFLGWIYCLKRGAFEWD